MDQPRTAAPALPPPPPPPAGRGPGDQDKDKRKDKDPEQEASMEEDDSIDTAAWDKLGISAAGPAAPVEGVAGLRAALGSGLEGMSISIPNQYGSNMGPVSSPPLGAAPVSVEGLGGGVSPFALSPNPSRLRSVGTPGSGGRGSTLSGSVKPMKKTAVRKVSAEAVRAMEPLGAPVTPRQSVMALAAPTAPPVDQLLQDASKTVLISKAKRTKTVPAAPVRTSSHLKGAKGNMPSLQRAQLLQAQKNMEISGNPPPRFTVLVGFSDDHLHEVLDASGVDPTCVGGARELISLVRAKKLAQAALAAAVVARADHRTEPPEGGDAAAPSVPDERGQATGVAPSPSPFRGKGRRVAKAITSRGVHLRNCMI